MAKPARATAGTPAIRFLEANRAAFEVRSYAFEEADGGIAAAAARALGVEPDRLLKCLLVSLDGRLVSVLVGGDRELDLKAFARLAKGRKADLAALAEAERHTGYVKGGISPFGQRRPTPVYLDEAALAHATVMVNGGRRGIQIELAPQELVRLAGAVVGAYGR